jgi:hypothetical protein
MTGVRFLAETGFIFGKANIPLPSNVEVKNERSFTSTNLLYVYMAWCLDLRFS